jgi:hypothetical protein
LPSTGILRRRVLGISPAETRLSRRGFRIGPAPTRTRLEAVGAAFVAGYHAALLDDRPLPLDKRLGSVPAEFRGFAFEGAAMALVLIDSLTPWNRSRFAAFLAGPGEPHAYMIHVGAGWALARLRRGPSWLVERLQSVPTFLDRFHPLYRWLAIDGYGFHQGYFAPARHLAGQPHPRGLPGYARRAFDQGLGRSLWFAEGANDAFIALAVARFPLPRQADLWSGVGLAATYAGGVEQETLERLRELAGHHHPHLAQGAAFAAKARARAGIPSAVTEMGCQVLCGTSAAEAAALTDRELATLPLPEADARASSGSNYETWRRRIRSHFEGRGHP